MTIQEIINAIENRIPEGREEDTVDTVKRGDPSREVTNIVVTFMATREVLGRAVELGANFVITHEPTFYNHRDELDWLEGDPVAGSKREWIEKNGLVVWRFHDGLHRFRPDGIVAGFAERLGWNFDPDPKRSKVFSVTPQTASALAQTCKQRLGIPMVRVAGDPEAICRSVGLRVGACGGRPQIELFLDHDVDAVICGESPEWETCEYVRDAAAMGRGKALIVLGHANSEEVGMEWFARWLRPLVPADVAIHHVPAGDPFRFV